MEKDFTTSEIVSFFDGVDVTKYCVPKLIEIEMISGVFQVGETVKGTIKTNPNLASDPPYIQFREAPFQTTKEGKIMIHQQKDTSYTDTQVANLALESFGGNVGQILAGGGGSSSVIPSTYSSTSTLLNVDTIALANQPQGDFWIYSNRDDFKGGTSGAEASTNVRLVTDFTHQQFQVVSIFQIQTLIQIQFSKQEKRDFLLTDDPENDFSETTTTGKDIYTASGSVQTVQEKYCFCEKR